MADVDTALARQVLGVPQPERKPIAKHHRQAIELGAEQGAFLEKQSPCFRERHVESGAPGELLSADTFFVGTLKGVGKVYLHAVVDTYGSDAFGFLHVSKQPKAAVVVLPGRCAAVLPQARSAGEGDPHGQRPRILLDLPPTKSLIVM